MSDLREDGFYWTRTIYNKEDCLIGSWVPAAYMVESKTFWVSGHCLPRDSFEVGPRIPPPDDEKVLANAENILALLRNAAEKQDALDREIAGEREARHKLEVALTWKDKAMGVLFERLTAAGVDCSDLIP